MGEFEEGIIFQTGVVDALDLRQLLTLFGEPECGLGLTTKTNVECVETESFHIGGLRCHQRTEVRDEFCLHATRKRLFLANLFDACLQGRGGRLRPIELSIVDEQTA